MAAVVIVPLAYNPHGVAAFQPFKMAFVRLLAAVLAAAWAVWWMEGGRSTGPVGNSRLRKVLWMSVGLLVLTQVISSVFSVDPAQSFWGFLPNRGGFVSFLAELVIFAAVAAHLRTPAQMDRLTAAIILPTISIGLFAIAQSCGFDPLSLNTVATALGRDVVSLAGHHISLAAYLGMVIPFTLVRIYQTLRDRSGQRASFSVGVYGVIFLLQLTAVVLAKSRGPLLALLVVLATLAVAWAVLERSKTLFRWGVGMVLSVVVFLGVLSIPHGPLAPLQRLPVVRHFASAVPVGHAPDKFRTSLWNRAPDVVLAKAPFSFPDGRADLSPSIRTAFGFGSESLQGVLPRYWTWIDPEKRLEKSFHNLFWDSWFSSGALGAGATLLLFAVGILLSFRPLGVHLGRLEVTAGLLVGILTVLGFVARFGPGYFGLGIQAGLAGGLVAVLAGSLLFSREAALLPRPPLATALPVIAAGAALVGHLVETAFAFPVASTSLLFWICLGIVAAHARQSADALPVERPTAAQQGRPWALPLLAGLAATALIFAFVHLDFVKAMSWGEILAVSMTRITSTKAPSHLVPLVILPSLALMGAFAAAEVARRGGQKWLVGRRTTFLAAMLAVVYAVFKAGQTAAIGPLPGPSIPMGAIVRQAARAESLVIAFFVISAALLALLGGACADRSVARARACSRRGLLVACVLALVVALTAYPIALRFVLADTAAASANLRAISPEAGTRRASLELLGRAIQHDPMAYEYRLRFAEAGLNLAAESDARSGDALLERAGGVLTAGHALSPLNPISYAHARLHMRRALAESRPVEQKSHAMEARRHFQEAVRWDPTADQIWVEQSVVEGGLLGDREADEAGLRHADSLIEPDTASLWAEAYAKWSVHEGFPLLKQRYAERGLIHFRRALEFAALKPGSTFALHLGKGTLHRNLGQLPEARAAFQAAVGEGHATDGWRAEAMLAHTLSDLGDNPSALPHAVKALESAPAEFHAALSELKAELEK